MLEQNTFIEHDKAFKSILGASPWLELFTEKDYSICARGTSAYSIDKRAVCYEPSVT